MASTNSLTLAFYSAINSTIIFSNYKPVQRVRLAQMVGKQLEIPTTPMALDLRHGAFNVLLLGTETINLASCPIVRATDHTDEITGSK